MASKKQFSGSRLVARDREINKGAEWVLRATITLHGMDECPAPVLRRVANRLRAGADHLDVALHEPGAPRRAENVTGYRIVPFTGVLAVRLASASDLG